MSAVVAAARLRAGLFTAIIVVTVTACGTSASPAGPSSGPPPAASVVGLTIAPTPELMLIGKVTQLSATATYSDGSTKTVTPLWTSDRLDVATVTADGHVIAKGSGEVTLTGTFSGGTASRRLRVVPDYAGGWSAVYRVADCTDSQDWRGACDDEDPLKRWAMHMTLQQTGTTVTGTLAPFTNVMPEAHGDIALDGTLRLTGLATLDRGYPFEGRIEDWTMRSDNGIDLLEGGGFVYVGSSPKYKGEYRLFCDILGGTKTIAPSGVAVTGARDRAPMRPSLPILPRDLRIRE